MSFGGYGGSSADPFGGQPSGGGWSGPPTYQAPPPSPPSQQTNPLATLSIVFAFLFAPAGVVLGHVALSQIKRLHQKGRDRAIIGLVLSHFMIVVVVVALVVWLVLVDGKAPPTAEPPKARTSSVPTSTTASSPSSTSPSMSPGPVTTPGAPVTDTKMVDALLDAPALAGLLGQEFDTTRNPGPKIGGREAMAKRFEDESTPRECIGAIWVAPPGVYRSANVAHFATQTWSTAVQGPIMSVEEAVVVLPSAAEAQALFSSFSQQWKACDGRTVTENRQADNGFDYLFTPKDVRLVDSIVAATVTSDRSTGGWETSAARALGVRNNYIVEVDISFFEPESGALLQSAGIEVAKAMMAKGG